MENNPKLNNFDFPKIFAVLVSLIEEQEQVDIDYTLEKIDKKEKKEKKDGAA